jgi:predicted transcriptional regulator
VISPSKGRHLKSDISYSFSVQAHSRAATKSVQQSPIEDLLDPMFGGSVEMLLTNLVKTGKVNEEIWKRLTQAIAELEEKP